MPCSAFLPPKLRYFLKHTVMASGRAGSACIHHFAASCGDPAPRVIPFAYLRPHLFSYSARAQAEWQRTLQAKRGQQEDGKRQCNREKH